MKVVQYISNMGNLKEINAMKENLTFQGTRRSNFYWRLGGTLLILALFALVGRTVALENVWTSIGPYGGRISDIAISPSNPQVVYAATGTGLFMSTDGGASWTHIIQSSDFRPSIAALGANAVAIDPTHSQTIYAGGSGMYKSANGGISWTAINSGLPANANVTAIRINPSNPQTLYLATYNNGVYKSTDGGSAWIQVNSLSYVKMLVIDPSNPQILYTLAKGGVYKTTDGGGSWTGLNLDMTTPGGAAVWIAMDPSNTRTLYVGTNKDGVLKSTDGGATWARANTGLTTIGVTSILVDPFRPQNLFVWTSAGEFRSADGGGSWTHTRLGLGSMVITFASDPSRPQTIYAGTQDGVFKSTDVGTTWTQTNAGIVSFNVKALAKSASNVLYVATQSAGVFKTADGGGTWRQVYPDTANLPSQVLALATDPSDPPTLYFEAGPLFKSTDAGTTWRPIWTSSNLPSGQWRTDIRTIAVDPSNPHTIYLGMATGVSLVERRVLKTTDGGKTWAPMDRGLPPTTYVQAMAIDPSNSKTLYLSNYDVYKSTDGGASWTALGNMLPKPGVYALAIDPANPQTIYAGGRSVFKSTDGGATWTTLNSGLTSTSVYALTIDPTNSQIIYAGTTDAGVFRSTNGGASWTNFSTGLTSQFVWALLVDPANQMVFAGTSGGGVFAVNVSGAKSLLVTDFNADGTVDLIDFFQFALVFGKKIGDAGFNVRFDLNGDGRVDFEDFFIFITDFGKKSNLAKAAASRPGVNDHARLSVTTVASSEALTARISGANLSQLRGFSLVVSYDPSALTFVRAERPVDALLSRGGTTPLFLAHEVEPGRVIIADVIAGSGTASGDGDLANLIFRPIRSEVGAVNVNLAQVLDGAGGVNTLSAMSHPTPSTYTLSQNYPNPFNPETQIAYSLAEAGRVRLTIYNLLGQKVRSLVDATQATGSYEVRWDGRDEAGRRLATGVYLYRLEANGFSAVRRMVFLK